MRQIYSFFSLFILLSSFVFANENIIDKSLSSVVSIRNNSISSEANPLLLLNGGNNSSNKGSGVIVDKRGLVITNNHLIKNKDDIRIILKDGREFKGILLKNDEDVDLALIKIDANDIEFTEIVFSNSDDIQVGQKVFAMGDPFGIGLSVTSGIVSALPSHIRFSSVGNLIQTDASINPGNSGGALIDEKGHLIGINTGIYGKVSLGIGFAIPSNVVKLFVERSLKGQELKRYWLGMTAINVDKKIAKAYKISVPKGIIITDIYENSPAKNAGLQKGDIIIKLNDYDVGNLNSFSYFMAMLENENPINVEIIRDGAKMNLIVTPEIPKDNMSRDLTEVKSGFFKGITVSNNTNLVSYDLGTLFDQKGAVIYKIEQNNFLSSFGIKVGDIIISINNESIESVSDFIKFLNNNKNTSSFNIEVKRKNSIFTLRINYR